MTTPGTEIVRVGALALDPTQADWTERQQAALVQLGVAGASAGDLAVFLHQCQRTGLDPFTKQIYMIGRKDRQSNQTKWTIQTGIDGFRVVAERPRQSKPSPYRGQDGPYWCGPDGEWRDVWLDKTPPIAAKVGIKRADWSEPIYAVAHFHEYAQTTTYNNQTRLTKMWAEKGALMIAKCAEALAFRKAFPQDLSGIYTDEEMAQADVVRVESERVDTKQEPEAEPDWLELLKRRTGNFPAIRELYQQARAGNASAAILAEIKAAGDAAQQATPTPAPAAAENEPVDAEVVDEHAPDAPSTEPVSDAEPAATPEQLTAIAAAVGEHGVKEREDRLAVVSLLVGDRITSSSQLTKSEASHVIDAIAKHAESGQITETIAAARAAYTEKVPA
ncbi:phage recombination protein Bet [Actinokineospora sp.]|uniref:phage recombination protein Bet n=1 Tax=Actinokineospora sp. TaxID=1872133 RepID=UPI003D6B48F1